MLEKHYDEADARFLDFVETFAPGREDAKLEGIILTPVSYTHLDVYKRQGNTCDKDLPGIYCLKDYADGRRGGKG